MGSAREFQSVRIDRGGQVRPAMRIECSNCGVAANYVVASGKSFSATQAAHYFRNHGWTVGPTPRGDVCPTCGKGKPKLAIVASTAGETVPVEPPREMSRDDRRIILDKIDDLYLGEAAGYAAPWTDDKVATDLGVPRRRVTAIREEFFGPLGSNAEAEARAALGAVEAALSKVASAAEALAQDIAALKAAAATLRAKLGGEGAA